jgi:hypothetical protein
MVLFMARHNHGCRRMAAPSPCPLKQRPIRHAFRAVRTTGSHSRGDSALNVARERFTAIATHPGLPAGTGTGRLGFTKTERRRSANLLQMPRGQMCKLRQGGRACGGRPARSRGFDQSLQPPPAVAARLRGECQGGRFPPDKCPKKGKSSGCSANGLGGG